jgi:hypothetical protein
MNSEFDPIKTGISEAKLAANRANALKSSGPKTAEGKAISRLNAVKHGVYAETVSIPGEDGEAFDRRFNSWSRDLNPLASEAADYLVAMLVRKSIRLDRCNVVRDATVADLARNALHARASRRSRRIEKLTRMLDTHRDTAVRGLRESPEGCDLLIKEWELLEIALVEPATWDDDNAANASMLQGRYWMSLGLTPDPLVPATDAVVKHRKVAAQLKANEGPGPIAWDVRYGAKVLHDDDLARVVDLELAAILAKDGLRTTIARELADLRSRRVEVAEKDRQELSTAVLKARLDDTDRGKLMDRHESDLDRGIHRCHKELRDYRREGLQPYVAQVLVSDRPWEGAPRKPVSPARNEPTRGVNRDPLAGWEPVENTGYSEVDVSITPGIGPKHKQ